MHFDYDPYNDEYIIHPVRCSFITTCKLASRYRGAVGDSENTEVLRAPIKNLQIYNSGRIICIQEAERLQATTHLCAGEKSEKTSF